MEIYEIINWVLLGLTALFTLIGALKGLSRGIGRQTVRLISIIVSIVISFLLARMVGSTVFGKLEGMTVEELVNVLVTNGVISSAEDLKILTYFDTATIEYILAIPLGLIVLPLIFAVMFPVVSGLMLIAHAIVSGALGFTKKKNTWLTRLLGMGVGAIQGVLVTAVVLVPVIGILNTAGAAFEKLEGEEPNSEGEIFELYDEFINPVKNGPVFKTVSVFGGQLIYEQLASVKLEGTRVNMVKQVDTVVEIFGQAGALGEIDIGNLSAEDKAAIDSIINTINTSEYFSPLLANIASGFSRYAKDGEMISTMEEPLKTLMCDVLTVFETSNKECIGGDIDTFRSLLYLLSDAGLLSSVSSEGDGDMMELLSKTDENGKTVLTRAIGILSANERTKPIVSSLTKIALSTMTDNMSDEEAEAVEIVYDSVKEGLNDLIKIDKETYENEDEYRDAVAESLNETLVKNDIQLSTDEVKELADHVVDNYGSFEEITDEDITLIILEYYDQYSEK